jgi:hypothetical protein
MRHESVSGGRGLSPAGVQWYPGSWEGSSAQTAHENCKHPARIKYRKKTEEFIPS